VEAFMICTTGQYMHASIACLLLYQDYVWVSLRNAIKAKQSNFKATQQGSKCFKLGDHAEAAPGAVSYSVRNVNLRDAPAVMSANEFARFSRLQHSLLQLCRTT
jgi:hypothetical protein